MSNIARSLLTLSLVVITSSCGLINRHEPTLQVMRTEVACPDHDVAEDAGGKLHVAVKPEKQPINSSPWYAFRIYSAEQEPVEICVNYLVSKHRYTPKYSTQNGQWQAFHPSEYQVLAGGKELRLTFTKPPGVMDIAAQELIGPQDNERLLKELSISSGAQLRQIGLTCQARPLLALHSSAAAPEAPLLILLGRQHPPEVPGSIAMEKFLRHLFSDDPKALQLRRHVHIVAVPMLNPDGVVCGNWRCNSRGVDLNRDWGPFSQAETAAVQRLIDQLCEAGARPAMMIDFHATTTDLLYTQHDSFKGDPQQLVKTWHSAISERLAPYPFPRKPSKTKSNHTAKSYFARQYQIPAVTLELGDETERQVLRQIGQIAAEELICAFEGRVYKI